MHDAASGDRVLSADFSQFCEEGEFYIKVGSSESSVFTISKAPYKNLLGDVKKSLYFFRCGSALHRNRAGKFGRKPCHIEPASFYDDKEKTLDVSGGWHDAGDYSRCVVTGCVALGHLLYAYSLFPEVFGDKDGISQSGKNCPLIIEECLYELEWLLKMQDKDGGVYHRVSSLSYAGLVMPYDDKEKQYIFRKTACWHIFFLLRPLVLKRSLNPSRNL
jgi:endoglucanase